jgi:Uri superfamily endonuclease
LKQTVFVEKQPGTYALIMSLPDSLVLQVGKLGSIELQPGFYIYVGSALGGGGLGARLTRHLKLQKKCHWHIDYLTSCTPVKEIWYAVHPGQLECGWAKRLSGLSTSVIQSFGASDCRCDAHLFHFQQIPAIKKFTDGRFKDAGFADAEFVDGVSGFKHAIPEIRVWHNSDYHLQVKLIPSFIPSG